MCGTAVIIQQDDGQARAWPVRCKSWSCPKCAPIRRRQLRAKAYAGNPTTFITLTSNPHYGIDPTDRAKRMAEAWRKLLRRIEQKYHYGKIAYLIVIEATARGEPHMHVLARTKYIDQKWLSQQWEDLTGAKIVHIKKIDNQGQAARYVAKYTSKKPIRYGTMKRYWCSQSYRVGPKRKMDTEKWRGATTYNAGVTIAAVIVAFQSSGFEVVVSRGGYLEATGPPGATAPYTL